MSTPDPKTEIVHPFGITGGAYEVDGAGLWKVRATWCIAIFVIGFTALRALLEINWWLVAAVAVVGIGTSLALSVDVARGSEG